MSFERFDGVAPGDSQKHEEVHYTRVSVPNLFPHSQQGAEAIQLEIPGSLNLEQAMAEWHYSGGQVRSFSYGPNAEMRLRTYSLPEWLMKQKGARPVYDAGEPPIAA